MPDTTMLLSALAYALLTGVLNLIFSRKTQIEEWCAANPRLAAFGMFLRSVGFDPHNLWAFATLFITKKLPAIKLADSAVVQEEVRKIEAKKSADDTVRIIPPLGVLLFLGLCVHQQACSSTPAPKAPCDPLTLAQITAFCSAEAYACGKAGKTEAECTAECDAKLDARAEECRK